MIWSILRTINWRPVTREYQMHSSNHKYYLSIDATHTHTQTHYDLCCSLWARFLGYIFGFFISFYFYINILKCFNLSLNNEENKRNERIWKSFGKLMLFVRKLNIWKYFVSTKWLADYSGLTWDRILWSCNVRSLHQMRWFMTFKIATNFRLHIWNMRMHIIFFSYFRLY